VNNGWPSRRALERGLGAGILSLVLYLSIVVVTTPSLLPVQAVNLSLILNWWVIGWVSIGTGIQVFLVTYAKDRGCPIKHGRSTVGTSGFFSGASSFLSFLSLVPVGCCGTWLYLISFLPGLLGTGLSGFLVTNGSVLAVGGLALMTISILYTYLSVRRRLHSIREFENSSERRTTVSTPLKLDGPGEFLRGKALLHKKYRVKNSN